ncbi:hypothetical protein PSHT_06196 [Puccinia striiformis]|uniref:Uncharacterized protein n=2 Tax=Puccinia striiformis TaxID=27350 RepID=A0A2S4W8N1_9BASI|nr:hypothetical protein PSTT_03478 [Puccinia striiformis]POW18101.1 hypothetical protein PSHT_06196 [Puccinia striiformis]
MRFSGVESILGWQRFVINAFARRDLIQVVVLHKNKAALNGQIVFRLLLGWDYCHVDSNPKALFILMMLLLSFRSINTQFFRPTQSLSNCICLKGEAKCTPKNYKVLDN